MTCLNLRDKLGYINTQELSLSHNKFIYWVKSFDDVKWSFGILKTNKKLGEPSTKF